MLKKLFHLFATPEVESGDSQHGVHLAAAALLVETARADFVQDGEEEQALRHQLLTTLGLSAAEVDDMLGDANAATDNATSLYQFTRLINDNYNPAQKIDLIAAMWRVAYADGRIDKYEEHLIRRVAELTYVPHEDYIRTKLAAR